MAMDAKVSLAPVLAKTAVERLEALRSKRGTGVAGADGRIG